MDHPKDRLRVARLSANNLEMRAEALVRLHQPRALERPTAVQIEEVIIREARNGRLSFDPGQDLGLAEDGQKILGRCIFDPPAILIDQSLMADSEAHRLRSVLAHEYGHFTLHRDQPCVSEAGPLEDTKQTVESSAKTRATTDWSPADWREWQARRFAAAILVPRKMFRMGLAAAQKSLGWTRNFGTVHMDMKRTSEADRLRLYERLSQFYQVSRTVIRIRVVELGLAWGVGATRSRDQANPGWRY